MKALSRLMRQGCPGVGFTIKLEKYRVSIYTVIMMIRNFKSKLAQDVFDGVSSRYARKLPLSLHDKTRRLLDQLNAITRVETLKIPPSNKLSKLTGNLSNYWRVKIDKQWAIIFRWEKSNAYDVDIVDYH